ncbi:hypothetical protein MMC34_006498 [Xylographa carneopallida]|nr:hypothetical protein [Xylographa carneopallida]
MVDDLLGKNSHPKLEAEDDASTRAPSLYDVSKPSSRPVSLIPSTKEATEPPATRDGPPQDAIEFPSGLRLAAIIVALVASVFLIALDMTIIATAIPRITDEFHSLDQVGWYGSAFFLVLASFQSTWGKAYKYFPLKASFLVAIFIFEVGSLICGVAQNSITLIVGRAIAGAGGGGIASGAYTIVAFSAPPNSRPAYTGILGATFGVASVIGPLLGGVFTSNATWRWCFYINLPIGGAAAAIIFLTFTTPEVAKPLEVPFLEKLKQMDLPGAFTIMAAVICYLLALQWGGVTKSWSDSTVIGTLVGFVLLLGLFAVIEWYQGDRALLLGRLLKKRVILVGALYQIFLSGGFFVLLYYLPLYFQVVSGVSASESGIRNLGLVISVSLFSIVSGGLITAFGHYVPLMIVASVFATVGAGLVYTLGVGSASSQWIGYQVISGIGLGLGFQIPVIVAQASVEPTDISTVTSIILFFQSIGGSFFVSAAQAAFANMLVGNLVKNVPSLDPQVVVTAGAGAIQSTFSPDVVPAIVASYLTGLHVSFALTIALAGVSLLIAFFSPWQRINLKAVTTGGA